jgi:TRAP-type C4-dicarboxylate transport system permease small subunit
MKVSDLYKQIANVLKKIVEALVIISFALMVILVFAQVVTRYLTNNSLTWSEELSRFIMVWMVYLASILTYSLGQR